MPILTDDEREGTTLADGKYALQRVIGRGGMATVFEALHTWTGRKVAVKVLHSSLTENAEVSLRYLQEARAATALDHPNVVEVLDMGREEADGTVYIVFELLRGESLRDRLDKLGTLTTLEVATLLVPILDALVVAHQRGIVHRDLKPDNIFLQEDGRGGFRPKLLDFGIAKMEETGGPKQTGPVSGTVEYLSPERAQGMKTGPATDVWSMGVVIYECLTGRLPFERESITATLLSIVQCPAPSLRNTTDIPPATAELVEVCLAKDLNVRFPDAFALRDALIRTVGAALSPVTLPSLPSIPTTYASTSIAPPEASSSSSASIPAASLERARSRRRMGVAVFAALVALLVVLGVWRAGESGAGEMASAPDDAPTPTFAPQTVLVAPAEPTQVGVVVVSPDPTVIRESDSIGPRPTSNQGVARERATPAQTSSVMSPRATSSSEMRPQRGANGSLILD